MTYEEMELTIFGTNDNPIPGSWRDEVVKMGMIVTERNQPDLLNVLIIMAKVEQQKMHIAAVKQAFDYLQEQRDAERV